MLELDDVSVHLGRRQVLRNLSLTVRGGELLAICGANGAGKSTLLKAILGEVPATGTIRLDGIDVPRARPAQLASLRAVLPQESDVAFGFTLGEVVAMGREAGDFAPRPDVDHLALAAVGLVGRERDEIRSLSGGERQRGHLARALAQVWEPVSPRGPRWLMLDEPVASLDLGHQLQMMRLARGYADAGGGVIAVMHDLNLTAMHADRIVLMHRGLAVAAGAAGAIFRDDLLAEVFGCDLRVGATPPEGIAFVLPQAAA